MHNRQYFDSVIQNPIIDNKGELLYLGRSNIPPDFGERMRLARDKRQPVIQLFDEFFAEPGTNGGQRLADRLSVSAGFGT